MTEPKKPQLSISESKRIKKVLALQWELMEHEKGTQEGTDYFAKMCLYQVDHILDIEKSLE